MTKIFIIFTLSILPIFANDNILEGCGNNEKEALNSLSKAIYTIIKSNYTKTTKTSGNKWYETKAKQSLTISTNLWLKNIKSYKKNRKICKKTTKSQVKKDSFKILQELKNFSIKNLPKESNQKNKQVNNILNKIEFAKYNTLKNHQYKFLNNLERKIRLLKNKGSVVFIANSPNIKISISNHKPIKPSEITELESGKYSYVTNSKCPIKGKFKIITGDKKEINLNILPFPVITLSSNKKNAKARINSKIKRIDKKVTIKKCSGKIKWSIEFEDNTKDGSIDLRPGMIETIRRNFISKKELKSIKTKVSNFTKSKEVTISYGNANSDKDKWNDIEQINIGYFTNNDIYQYGSSMIFGKKEKWRINDISSLELLGSFRLRLTELPNGKPVIIFNTIPILPYIGIDAGWDISEIISSSNNIYGVSRWLVGMSFLVHSKISINLEFQKDFGSKDDDSLFIGAGFLF